MSDQSVSLSRGLPETILPIVPLEWSTALEAATAASDGDFEFGLAAMIRGLELVRQPAERPEWEAIP